MYFRKWVRVTSFSVFLLMILSFGIHFEQNSSAQEAPSANTVPDLVERLQETFDALTTTLNGAETDAMALQDGFDPNADQNAVDSIMSQGIDTALNAIDAEIQLNDFCGKVQADVSQQKRLKGFLQDAATVNQSLLANDAFIGSSVFNTAKLSFQNSLSLLQQAALDVCKFAPEANPDVFPPPGKTTFLGQVVDATTESWTINWGGLGAALTFDLDVLADDRDENLEDADFALIPAENLTITTATPTQSIAAGSGALGAFQGSLQIINGGKLIRYTTPLPGVGFNGVDEFTYEICDTTNLCDTATVSVKFNLGNQPPTALDDIYGSGSGFSVQEDVDFVVTDLSGVLKNDTDPNSSDTLTVIDVRDTLLFNPLRISVLSPTALPADVCCTTKTPMGGTVIMLKKGGFTYEPAPNFAGEDEFFYEIRDDFAGVSNAKVQLTVAPVNDAPAAQNDFYTVTESVFLDAGFNPVTSKPIRVRASLITTDAATNPPLGPGPTRGVLANDSDPVEGDDVRVTRVTDDVNFGTLTLSADGTFTYETFDNIFGTSTNPSPIVDRFQYEVCDTGTLLPGPPAIIGPDGCSIGTAQITINPVPRSDVTVSRVAVTPDKNYTNANAGNEVLSQAANNSIVIAGTEMVIELDVNAAGSTPQDMFIEMVGSLPSGMTITGFSPSNMNCNITNPATVTECSLGSDTTTNPQFTVVVDPRYVLINGGGGAVSGFSFNAFKVFMNTVAVIDPDVNTSGENTFTTLSMIVREQANLLIDDVTVEFQDDCNDTIANTAGSRNRSDCSSSVFDSGATEAIAGWNARFTVDVLNLGPSAARSLTLTDDKTGSSSSTDVDFVSCTNLNSSTSTSSCTTNDLAFSTPGSSASGSYTYEVKLQPDYFRNKGASLNSTFTLGSSTSDPTTPNTGLKSMTVTELADLWITNLVNDYPNSNDPVGRNDGDWALGERVQFAATVFNIGPSDARNTIVTTTPGAASSLSAGTSNLGALSPGVVHGNNIGPSFTLGQSVTTGDNQFDVTTSIASDSTTSTTAPSPTATSRTITGVDVILVADLEVDGGSANMILECVTSACNVILDRDTRVHMTIKNNGPSNLTTSNLGSAKITFYNDMTDNGSDGGLFGNGDDIDINSVAGGFSCDAIQLSDNAGLNFLPEGGDPRYIVRCEGGSINASITDDMDFRYKDDASGDFKIRGVVVLFGGADTTTIDPDMSNNAYGEVCNESGDNISCGFPVQFNPTTGSPPASTTENNNFSGEDEEQKFVVEAKPSVDEEASDKENQDESGESQGAIEKEIEGTTKEATSSTQSSPDAILNLVQQSELRVLSLAPYSIASLMEQIHIPGLPLVILTKLIDLELHEGVQVSESDETTQSEAKVTVEASTDVEISQINTETQLQSVSTESTGPQSTLSRVGFGRDVNAPSVPTIALNNSPQAESSTQSVSQAKSPKDFTEDPADNFIERIELDPAPPANVCTDAFASLASARNELDSGFNALFQALNNQATSLSTVLDGILTDAAAAAAIVEQIRDQLGSFSPAAEALGTILSELGDTIFFIEAAQTLLNEDVNSALSQLAIDLEDLLPPFTLTSSSAVDTKRLSLAGDLNDIANDLQTVIDNIQSAIDMMDVVTLSLDEQINTPAAILVRESDFSNAELLLGWGPASAFPNNDTLRPDAGALVDWMEPDNVQGTTNIRIGIMNVGLAVLPPNVSLELSNLSGLGPDGNTIDPGTLTTSVPPLVPGQQGAITVDTNFAYRAYDGTLQARLMFEGETVDDVSKNVIRCDSPYQQQGSPTIQFTPEPRAITERSFQFVPVEGIQATNHMWNVYASDDAVDFTAQANWRDRQEMVSEVETELDRFQIFCRQPVNYIWEFVRAEPLNPEEETILTLTGLQDQGKTITQSDLPGGVYTLRVQTILEQEVVLSGEATFTGFVELSSSNVEYLVIPKPNLFVRRVSVGPNGSSLTGWTEEAISPSNFEVNDPVNFEISPRVINFDLLQISDLPEAAALMDAPSANVQILVDGNELGSVSVDNIPLVQAQADEDNDGAPVPASDAFSSTSIDLAGMEGEHLIEAIVDPDDSVDEASEFDNSHLLTCQSYWNLTQQSGVGDLNIQFGPSEAIMRNDEDGIILTTKKQPEDGFSMSVSAVLNTAAKMDADLDQVCPIAFRLTWDYGDGSDPEVLGADNTTPLQGGGSQLDLATKHFYEEGSFEPVLSASLGEGTSQVEFRALGSAMDITSRPVVVEIITSTVGTYFIGFPGLPEMNNDVTLDILWNGNTPSKVEFVPNWGPAASEGNLDNPTVAYDMGDLRETSEGVHNILMVMLTGIDPDTGEEKVDSDTAKMTPISIEFPAGFPDLGFLVSSSNTSVATAASSQDENDGLVLNSLYTSMTLQKAMSQIGNSVTSGPAPTKQASSVSAAQSQSEGEDVVLNEQHFEQLVEHVAVHMGSQMATQLQDAFADADEELFYDPVRYQQKLDEVFGEMQITLPTGPMTESPDFTSTYDSDVEMPPPPFRSMAAFQEAQGTNNAPELTAIDNQSISENNVLSVAVTCTDIDGDNMSLSLLNAPSGAVLNTSSNGVGSISYTPDFMVVAHPSTEQVFSDIEVSCTDDDETNPLTVSDTFNLTVTDTNRAPVATNDSTSTPQNTAVSLNVLNNDTDADSDTLSISSNTNPSNGSVVCINGACDYTPTSTFSGSDSFTYTVSDGFGNTSTAIVTITVVEVSDTALTLAMSTSVSATGVITSNPSGINCATSDNQCIGDFTFNTQVVLTATPGANSEFVSWGGNDCLINVNNPAECTVTMATAINVTATFRPQTVGLNVTAEFIGEGRGLVTIVNSNSLNGLIECGTSKFNDTDTQGIENNLCAANAPFGSQVELLATPAPGAIIIDDTSAIFIFDDGRSCTSSSFSTSRSIGEVFENAVEASTLSCVTTLNTNNDVTVRFAANELIDDQSLIEQSERTTRTVSLIEKELRRLEQKKTTKQSELLGLPPGAARDKVQKELDAINQTISDRTLELNELKLRTAEKNETKATKEREKAQAMVETATTLTTTNLNDADAREVISAQRQDELNVLQKQLNDELSKPVSGGANPGDNQDPLLIAKLRGVDIPAKQAEVDAAKEDARKARAAAVSAATEEQKQRDAVLAAAEKEKAAKDVQADLALTQAASDETLANANKMSAEADKTEGQRLLALGQIEKMQAETVLAGNPNDTTAQDKLANANKKIEDSQARIDVADQRLLDVEVNIAVAKVNKLEAEKIKIQAELDLEVVKRKDAMERQDAAQMRVDAIDVLLNTAPDPSELKTTLDAQKVDAVMTKDTAAADFDVSDKKIKGDAGNPGLNAQLNTKNTEIATAIQTKVDKENVRKMAFETQKTNATMRSTMIDTEINTATMEAEDKEKLINGDPAVPNDGGLTKQVSDAEAALVTVKDLETQIAAEQDVTRKMTLETQRDQLLTDNNVANVVELQDKVNRLKMDLETAKKDLADAEKMKMDLEQEKTMQDQTASDAEMQEMIADEREKQAQAEKEAQDAQNEIDQKDQVINDPDTSDGDKVNAQTEKDTANQNKDTAVQNQNDAENNRRDMGDSSLPPDRDSSKPKVGPQIGFDLTAERDNRSKSWQVFASLSFGVGRPAGGPSSVGNPGGGAKLSGGKNQSFGFDVSVSADFDWSSSSASGSAGASLTITFEIPISVKPEASVTVSTTFSSGELFKGLFKPAGSFFDWSITVSPSVEIPIANPFAIPIAAIISGSLTYQISVEWDKSFFQGNTKVTDSMTVELDVWAVLDLVIARGGPFGAGSVSFQFQPKAKFLCATGSFGLRVSVGIGIFSATFETKATWKYGTCSPTSNIATEEADEFLQISGDRPFDRPDYAQFVNELRESNQFGVQELKLLNNSFPEATPQLATDGERFVLVWVQEDLSKPILESRELWYSVAGADLNFSEPQRLTNNNVPDATPRITVDSAGNFVLVWQRNKNLALMQSLDIHGLNAELNALGSGKKLVIEANDPLTDSPLQLPQSTETPQGLAPSLLAALAEQELVYAVFEPTQQVWSDPQLITDNDFLDEDPHLVSDELGNMMVVWSENHSSLPYPVVSPPNPSTLVTKHWDAESQTFGEMMVLRESDVATERSFAYRDGQLLYVWIEGSEAFATIFGGDNLELAELLDAGGSSNPAAAFSPEGTPIALWMKKVSTANENASGSLDSELMEAEFIDGNWTMGENPLEGVSINGFQLVTNPVAGDLALVWNQLSDSNGRGIDVFSLIYDRDMGGWTERKQLTDDLDIETSISAVLVGTDLILSYMKQALTFETETGTFSGADLEDSDIVYEDEPFSVPNVPTFGSSDLYILRGGLISDLAFVSSDTALSPQVPTLGEKVDLSVVVRNIGRMGVEGADTVTVELRDGSPNGPSLGTQTIPALPADEQATVTFSFNASSGNTEQIVYAMIDPSGAVEETLILNNTIAIPVITHNWRFATFDFEFDSRTLSTDTFADVKAKEGNAMSGEEVDDMVESLQPLVVVVDMLVENSGPVAAPEGVIEFSFALDNDVFTQQTVVGEAAIPALAPGERTRVEFVWDVTNLADDDYRFFGMIKGTQSVFEVATEDEGSNEFFMVVRRLPDLLVAPRIVQNAETGEAELRITVVNNGPTDAFGTEISVFAADARGQVTRRLLEFFVSDSIDAFGGFVTIQVPMPSIAQGEAELLVIIDPSNDINELNETNNSDMIMIE